MALKIAIVGTGNVARGNYVPFLSRQEDVELTYLSRTKEKPEALAAEFGGHVVGTAAELAAEDPDAVLVLTRETQRAEAIGALLEHRFRRLFFEKPLVARHGLENVCEEDFFTARDLLKQAEANGTQTAMVFNYRFFEQTKRAARLVAERSFGQALQVVAYSHYATWSHVIDLIHLFAGPIVTMAAIDSAEARGAGYNKAVDVGAAFRFANGAIGTILGKKMVLNEIVAFLDLKAATGLAPRTFMITTFAVTGFANFSSIAIQLGGIGALIPGRRGDLARLGFKAMLAATLANFTSACVAGVLG